MSALAGATVGVLGALAAFPRRLAAREVERQGGQLRRGVTRSSSHVVFGRTLLARMPEAEIAAQAEAARAAGRQRLSETAFLRLLGLVPAAAGADLARQSLLDQSRIAPADLDLLSLFDAFEHPAEPYSFRDLILARKYAGLVAGGATWGAIAASVHRTGPVASLAAKTLHVEDGRAIYARCAEGRLSELDGQLLLGLPAPGEAELEDLFAAAEAAEEAGRAADAAALYRRCLAIDPTDSVAAFNRANCLRVAGDRAEAEREYARAIKLDAGFVEAWFNLAGLVAEAGRPASSRRHLQQAITLDRDYADAVFNLASLEFDAGNLAEARRWWTRYLELDRHSDWARTAARGLRYIALHARRGTSG